MNTFKIVSWESIKLLFIIAFLCCMFANMLFLAKFNELDRGIDALYDAVQTNHQEIKDIVQFNKTPEK